MFTFACPQCRTHFQAEAGHVGREVTCGKCKAAIVVPQPPVAMLVPAASIPDNSKRWPIRKAFAVAIAIVIIALLLTSAIRWIRSSNRSEQNDFVKTPTGSFQMNRLKTELQDTLVNEVREILGKPDAEIECTIFQTDFFNKKRKPLPGITIPSASILFIYHNVDQTGDADNHGTDLVIWLVPDRGGFPRTRHVILAQHEGTIADMEESHKAFWKQWRKGQQQNGLEGLQPKW